MITGFLIVGALAVFTGSVLVLGYVVAAIAIATIVVLVLPPLAREINMYWTTWRGRIAREATARRRVAAEVPGPPAVVHDPDAVPNSLLGRRRSSTKAA
jgi:hypothetical protein